MSSRNQAFEATAGLLGDTARRDYSSKLGLFNLFAEPELRRAVDGLALEPGMRVLDAGCGTGEALAWLQRAVAPRGSVLGIDLSAAHVAAARRAGPPEIRVLQANLLELPFAAGSFDLIWCVNTINHLHDPVLGVKRLAALLSPRGRIALGQSSFLPDMYFAWDSRLERLTNEAVRAYYRDRYSLSERDLTKTRGLVGLLQRAGVPRVQARTYAIERTTPLDPAAERYLLDAIFRGTWGERLQPYLSEEDYAELGCLCDPEDPRFALRRPDFHFLQTFSLVVGEL
ncbi:MAG TPA: class I SAM-dependent methyltransferase [Steroidobacteraceae bacterium]|jgi:SAM-dependent methyltransferase